MYYFIRKRKDLHCVAGAVAGAVAVAVCLKGPRIHFESQPIIHSVINIFAFGSRLLSSSTFMLDFIF